MPPVALKKLNHRHEAIVNWLIAHPDRSLRDCAAFFGYTKEWVYRLVNSDLFQSVYRERAEAAGTVAVHAVKEKLLGLTGLAIEDAQERFLTGSASERFTSDTLKTTLSALGYGSQAQAQSQSQSVNVVIDPQLVIEARERAASLKEGRTEAKDVG